MVAGCYCSYPYPLESWLVGLVKAIKFENVGEECPWDGLERKVEV